MDISHKYISAPSKTFGAFFGYGSLVNAATHANRPVVPARLRGWRRAWRALPGRDIAFLTALPASEAEIEGLLAVVAPEAWAGLGVREAFYDRHDVTETVTPLDTPTTPTERVALYAVEAAHAVPPSDAAPVLMSYLDVVIGGYLDVFGPGAASRFVATTDGWEAPFLDDRAAPLYPRAQPLAPETRTCVDAILEETGARVMRA